MKSFQYLINKHVMYLKVNFLFQAMQSSIDYVKKSFVATDSNKSRKKYTLKTFLQKTLHKEMLRTLWKVDAETLWGIFGLT